MWNQSRICTSTSALVLHMKQSIGGFCKIHEKTYLYWVDEMRNTIKRSKKVLTTAVAPYSFASAAATESWLLVFSRLLFFKQFILSAYLRVVCMYTGYSIASLRVVRREEYAAMAFNNYVASLYFICK